ncbi:ribosomal maturation YjgA family protein [Microbacterium sp. USHLN272]|uniref:ribosomal maturation YjgA family protein n=1 Tax=Microbacterium sp. USHLN272 TaxID=3081287 RepID=UPI0030197E8E
MTTDSPSSPRARRRRRIGCAAAAAVVIGAGLFVHGLAEGPAGDIAGDALYAVLIYALIACALPRARSGAIAVSAALVCAAVEFAQLTGIPHALGQAFPPVHLVLGSGFDPRDLVVYVCAVAVAAALDAGVRSRWTARPEKAEGALPEESAF